MTSLAPCSNCGTLFFPTGPQKGRIAANKPVACSKLCRNKMNNRNHKLPDGGRIDVRLPGPVWRAVTLAAEARGLPCAAMARAILVCWHKTQEKRAV